MGATFLDYLEEAHRYIKDELPYDVGKPAADDDTSPKLAKTRTTTASRRRSANEAEPLREVE